jgi:hypothetical protein
VVIDATGLKVYGVGEWRVWKHRVSRGRTWRKLRLGVDERTKEIVAVEAFPYHRGKKQRSELFSLEGAFFS